MILQSELKQQRKLVRSLKKKSLWSRTLEEVYNYELLVIIAEQILSEVFSKEPFVIHSPKSFVHEAFSISKEYSFPHASHAILLFSMLVMVDFYDRQH